MLFLFLVLDMVFFFFFVVVVIVVSVAVVAGVAGRRNRFLFPNGFPLAPAGVGGYMDA